MAQVILVRHGETEWNREERFRGRTELDLTEKGIRQAQAIGRRLASMGVTTLYSSPLKRAMKTAEIIGQSCGLPVTPLPDLIDIDYGEWQGLSPDEVAQHQPELYQQWQHSPHLVKFPAGESLDEVQGRVSGVLDYVKTQHPQGVVGLVSHLVVCRVMVLYLLGWGNSYFWQVEQGLGTVNLFELRSPLPIVRTVNDTCHLKGI